MNVSGGTNCGSMTGEKTGANRSRVFGRFGSPKAESEITVKLLGAKLAKTTAQGSKVRGSYFTAKLVFEDASEATRVFLGKYGHEMGRRFTVILAPRNRLENSRRFARIAKSMVGKNSANANVSVRLPTAQEELSGIWCRKKIARFHRELRRFPMSATLAFSHSGRVAQLVEQRTENPCVTSSILVPTTPETVTGQRIASIAIRWPVSFL